MTMNARSFATAYRSLIYEQDWVTMTAMHLSTHLAVMAAAAAAEVRDETGDEEQAQGRVVGQGQGRNVRQCGWAEAWMGLWQAPQSVTEV